MREARLVYEILRDWGHDPDRLVIWRNNTGGALIKGRLVKFGLEGQGDLSGILKGGRRLEIECKTATGKQREAQTRFQRMIEGLGGLYILARSVGDIDERLIPLIGPPSVVVALP